VGGGLLFCFALMDWVCLCFWYLLAITGAGRAHWCERRGCRPVQYRIWPLTRASPDGAAIILLCRGLAEAWTVGQGVCFGQSAESYWRGIHTGFWALSESNEARSAHTLLDGKLACFPQAGPQGDHVAARVHHL
jgi:hypothetical protein